MRNNHIKHHSLRFKKTKYIYKSHYNALKHYFYLIAFGYLLYNLNISNLFKIYFFYSGFLYNLCHHMQHTNLFINTNMSKYHRLHHINSLSNLGVSSPIVDILLGTMNKKCRIKKKLSDKLLLLFPILSFKSIEISD